MIQFLSLFAPKLYPQRWKIQTQEARIIFRANNDENWGSSRKAKGSFEIKLPLFLTNKLGTYSDPILQNQLVTSVPARPRL